VSSQYYIEEELLIPSKTYRDFLQKNGIELTPRQRVKLVYYSSASKQKKLKEYRKLMTLVQDTDPKLYQCLDTIVSCESGKHVTDSPDSPEYKALMEAEINLVNTYAGYPLCLENGEMIRLAGCKKGLERYGIIHVFPDREEFLQRLLSKGVDPDDEEYVEFVDNAGRFYHSHVLITRLERVKPEQIPEELLQVLDAASSLVKGEGTIEGLQYEIDRMKKKSSY